MVGIFIHGLQGRQDFFDIQLAFHDKGGQIADPVYFCGNRHGLYDFAAPVLFRFMLFEKVQNCFFRKIGDGSFGINAEMFELFNNFVVNPGCEHLFGIHDFRISEIMDDCK